MTYIRRAPPTGFNLSLLHPLSYTYTWLDLLHDGSFLDVTGAALQIKMNSFKGTHPAGRKTRAFFTGTDCFWGSTAALGRLPRPSVKGINLQKLLGSGIFNYLLFVCFVIQMQGRWEISAVSDLCRCFILRTRADRLALTRCTESAHAR